MFSEHSLHTSNARPTKHAFRAARRRSKSWASWASAPLFLNTPEKSLLAEASSNPAASQPRRLYVVTGGLSRFLEQLVEHGIGIVSCLDCTLALSGISSNTSCAREGHKNEHHPHTDSMPSKKTKCEQSGWAVRCGAFIAPRSGQHLCTGSCLEPAQKARSGRARAPWDQEWTLLHQAGTGPVLKACFLAGIRCCFY